MPHDMPVVLFFNCLRSMVSIEVYARDFQNPCSLCLRDAVPFISILCSKVYQQCCCIALTVPQFQVRDSQIIFYLSSCVQVIYLDDEKKFNIEIIFSLIRSDLLNVGEYNVHLAKLIDGGRNSTLKC
jgi:hypothetical protein